MKFTIFKTVDYDILSKNIAIYQQANGEDPYLFMSYLTARAILNDKQPINILMHLKKQTVLTVFVGLEFIRIMTWSLEKLN